MKDHFNLNLNIFPAISIHSSSRASHPNFCDMKLDNAAQVVMCSGVMADGSLRIVRNGIGMIEQATVELPGIKGMWALRASHMDAFDTYLVISFVGETRVLAINADDELDEAELPGFSADAQVT